MSERETMLAEGKRLLAAATEGPWYWGGYSDGSVDLRARASMTPIVLSAMRTLPCVVTTYDETMVLTYEACGPCRAEYRKPTDPFVDYDGCERRVETSGTVWLRDPAAGFMRPANEWAVKEVPYRGDVVSVDHPDAALIVWLRNNAEALLAAAAPALQQEGGSER